MGHASSLPRRISTLQTASAANLYLLWSHHSESLQFTRDLEKLIHNVYACHSIRGEWFTPERLVAMIEAWGGREFTDDEIWLEVQGMVVT